MRVFSFFSWFVLLFFSCNTHSGNPNAFLPSRDSLKAPGIDSSAQKRAHKIDADRIKNNPAREFLSFTKEYVGWSKEEMKNGTYMGHSLPIHVLSTRQQREELTVVLEFASGGGANYSGNCEFKGDSLKLYYWVTDKSHMHKEWCKFHITYTLKPPNTGIRDYKISLYKLPDSESAEDIQRRSVGPALVSRITCESIVILQGERPRISVGIKNNTPFTVNLVGDLDASSSQWRYPYSYFTIERMGDTSYHKRRLARCGNMDGISASDFVEVKSGQLFNPYLRTDGVQADFSVSDSRNFEKTGVYKITYHYSSASYDFANWMGRDMHMHWFDWNTGQVVPEHRKEYANLLTLFEQVPKVEVESNPIYIRVIQNFKWGMSRGKRSSESF